MYVQMAALTLSAAALQLAPQILQLQPQVLQLPLQPPLLLPGPEPVLLPDLEPLLLLPPTLALLLPPAVIAEHVLPIAVVHVILKVGMASNTNSVNTSVLSTTKIILPHVKIRAVLRRFKPT